MRFQNSILKNSYVAIETENIHGSFQNCSEKKTKDVFE